MLSFKVHLSDLHRPSWAWSTDRWINGCSWIKPVTNPVLESLVAQDNTGRAFGFVRERYDPLLEVRPLGGHPDYSSRASVAVNRMHYWPGEYVTIEMRSGWFRLTAGPFGTAPLYLTTDNDILYGSWHLPDLHRHCRIDMLCARAVARALTRCHRYSTDTLFAGVHRLTERAVA